VTNEVPDETVFRATAECPECTAKAPDHESTNAALRKKVGGLQALVMALFEHGRKMFDEGVGRWHESETSLSAHEWLGLTREEYALWVELRPPKAVRVHREALEQIQKVLSGTLTVTRPLTQVVLEIVEDALKED
jgi:hypothetical protein